MTAARYWRASGMAARGGGDIELSALHPYKLDGDPGDPHYESVSAVLDFDGEPGSTVITDLSTPPKIFTSSGVQISADQAMFGTTSAFFNGSGEVSGADPSFAFGVGDFVIEAWARPTAFPIETAVASTLHTSTGTGVLLGFRSGGAPYMLLGNANDVIYETISPTAVPTNQWVHLAVCRFGTTCQLFVNGEQKAEMGVPISLNNSTLVIGRAYINLASRYYNGYLGGLRITKGVARYTAAFSPPTRQFPSSVGGETTLVRADTGVTLTSPIAPVVGTLAALQDEDTATTARMRVRPAGAALAWDFGDDVEIAAVRVGSGHSPELFISHLDLQYSVDGEKWVQAEKIGRFSWPGPNAMTDVAGAMEPIPVGAAPCTLASVAASAVTDSFGAPAPAGVQLARDIEFGGPGTIYGTTKTKGTPDNTPTKARVVLLAQRGKTLVRETWSDPATGAFEFRGIDTAQQFLTLAEDADGNFRPVAASMLVPEVLP